MNKPLKNITQHSDDDPLYPVDVFSGKDIKSACEWLKEKIANRTIIDLSEFPKLAEEAFKDVYRVKHIIKEGSREHVISYNSEGRKCSEPNCEINKK